MKFLHERNISHLDLKPQNILLSSLEKPHLKLAGVSGEQQGDVEWVNSELLVGLPQHPRSLGSLSSVMGTGQV